MTLAAAFAAAAGTSRTAPAAQFVPGEERVTSQPDMIDAEFSQTRAQITWCDIQGRLWIGNVNPVTGAFEPENGKALLVDGEAMSTINLYVTYNGPEWVPTSRGDRIVYTKFLPGLPHMASMARLAVAEETASGFWETETLPVMPGPDLLFPRLSPYGSEDPGDPTPRISYTDHNLTHFWRELDDPYTEEPIPQPPSVNSVRFVRGDRSMVFTLPVNGILQVFWYMLDTKVLTQLTFDSGNKDLRSVPWMWRAPELDDELVLMTVVENDEIRFYRFDSDGEAQLGSPLPWKLFHSIVPVEGGSVASNEPLLYNDQSYVFFAMREPLDDFPSSIWIADLNPSQPLVRQLTAGVKRARIDPEVFVTTSGPYIYYNRFDQTLKPGQTFCAACSEGVFRAFTGLEPPKAP